MVRSLSIFLLSTAAFLATANNTFSQLIVKGIIHSEGIARVTFKSDQSSETIPMYLYQPKEVIQGNDTTFMAKYEAPVRMVKNHNYTMRFTDGTVEKVVYVSGAVPENLVPKQKFTIDINLIDPNESDMTLIIFWSVSQSSYRALPLSNLNEIRVDAPSDFFWDDGTIPENENLKKTGL